MTSLLEVSQTGWGLFFGRFHPVLVHLPIGMLLVAFVLEALSKNRRLAVLGAAVLPVLIFGAMSAVAACIAGYLLSLSGGYEEDALDLHMWLGIGVAVISVLLCVLRRYTIFKKGWLYLSGAMVVLLSAAGHYGGTLTHGDDYLTAALPVGKKKAAAAALTGPTEEIKVYDQLVRPVLEQKCYGCHNAQKLKGGLRLDGMKHILEGGENGPVLKDSLPEMSELYKRLILSEDDDKRMPPKGKPQLTPQQVEIIYWWIAQGASPAATVKDLHKSPRIQLVLESLQPSRGGEANPFIPEAEASAPTEKAVAELEAIGVKVMPVAAQSGYVMINAINATAFGNREAELLLSLKSNIAWLKLSNTQVGDSALATIAKLPHLTRLHLENTAVTDAGLQALAASKTLMYLNLVGTKVTGKGLQALQQNKALQEVYVYKSAVTPAEVAALKKSMPRVKVDTGGYHMPVLATDTMVYRREKKS
ncbi:c-type cytochrome domain-containing protein [Chitinophaga sp.]|uniref:c-type cytochrome domain-containing protein n=1 Tax=Chitinophaga sp. TaxID=1869181 RepID=UPI0031D3B406